MLRQSTVTHTNQLNVFLKLGFKSVFFRLWEEKPTQHEDMLSLH